MFFTPYGAEGELITAFDEQTCTKWRLWSKYVSKLAKSLILTSKIWGNNVMLYIYMNELHVFADSFMRFAAVFGLMTAAGTF